MICCGDQVRINHHEYTVKAVNGPDRLGTYDFYVVDQQGRDHVEIVSEAITLHL
jgi:hypothetical protein